ncbi:MULTISPECIES: isopentenyl-diphosphate Delta-isomerase [unclassified Cryobacterium]|uniref:isopentenyl-diphosphate Delta-isomerase n=1 Tax=unclassified Cryobacterium TaxID=2649013 RepID=UPI001069408B|nr:MULTISPECIES: isopentenyl-diphosphate Delta-isomerase [unclassified Cryobacterium]TFD03539.1 isopentenyl-diphosphate Delta-isomerase [Cryobacterium sp. TMT1-66-1]TFD12802.1 isopentenyl-diphosphate Delta-isomerase [Cryobacterium sp. TMT1-2-2]
MHTANTLDEHVILLDDEGRHIGTAPKHSIHGSDTVLHLAFSCYVLNPLGEVLVTRRALTKKAWPGVWTNSFCGHPLPTEPLTQAVTRRAGFELGLELDHIDLALPQFRYRATDSNGIVENEICPVYLATTVAEPTPNPDEVAEYAWTRPADLYRAVTDAPWAFSPWMALQVQQLDTFRA